MVGGVVEGAEVQETSYVKEEVVVDDVSKRVLRQEVTLHNKNILTEKDVQQLESKKENPLEKLNAIFSLTESLFTISMYGTTQAVKDTSKCCQIPFNLHTKSE